MDFSKTAIETSEAKVKGNTISQSLKSRTFKSRECGLISKNKTQNVQKQQVLAQNVQTHKVQSNKVQRQNVIKQ